MNQPTQPVPTPPTSHLEGDMKIWYLYHSGYAIQTATCLLIFDYWNDEPNGETRALETGVFEPVNWLAEVARTSPDGAVPDVVVFASHKHGDHFNPLILEWQNTIPNIRYVLSNDIPKRHFGGLPHEAIHEAGHPDDGIQGARILRMKPHETLALPYIGMVIHTFKSTDAGVAFWVETNGKTIFHAGDLNLWYWEGESKSWNNNMIARYSQEIGEIKAWAAQRSSQADKGIDVAFLPIDPRLEGHRLDGYRLFMRELAPKAAFPMHFGTPDALATLMEDLADDPANFRDSLHLPAERGHRFVL